MAGHRRRIGTPTLAAKQIQRRQERLAEELEAARDPAARVHAAAEHLRSALKTAPAAMGERVADEVVTVLVAHADELLDPKTRRSS